MIPNIVKLRYENRMRLSQNIHVNCLKLYKKRLPTKEPQLPNEDKFNPTNEISINKTTRKKDKPEVSEEIKVEKITQYRIKKDKLQLIKMEQHYGN
jgi:hypothetical protein